MRIIQDGTSAIMDSPLQLVQVISPLSQSSFLAVNSELIAFFGSCIKTPPINLGLLWGSDWPKSAWLWDPRETKRDWGWGQIVNFNIAFLRSWLSLAQIPLVKIEKNCKEYFFFFRLWMHYFAVCWCLLKICTKSIFFDTKFVLSKHEHQVFLHFVCPFLFEFHLIFLRFSRSLDSSVRNFASFMQESAENFFNFPIVQWEILKLHFW